MSAVFHCCDDGRRDGVARHSTLNGIDWLAVVDRDAPLPADRQRFLRVHFIKPPGGLAVTPDNVRIEGGERIATVPVAATSFDGDVLVIEVESPGDFSRYTLRLVDATTPSQPLAGLDPVLAAIAFSFKVDCDSPFDCPTRAPCPPSTVAPPEIDYLARDYPALRQLLLDRLSILVPAWAERPPSDIGVVLVELLAYVGDRLAASQDTVATEAYIGTARRRVSVRRLARLIDYRMHDGCNARTWVHVEANGDDVPLPRGTQLLTAVAHQPPRLPPAALLDLLADRTAPLVFETMHDARLFAEQNAMRFYTWGGTRCCLPRGATRATLAGHRTSLTLSEPDELVLIFEEVTSPTPNAPPDRGHRCAVRLTRVTLTEDPLGGQLLPDPQLRTDDPVPVTEIEWRDEDALPFPVCISVVQGDHVVDDISVARGNVVLADHGLSRPAIDLATVGPPSSAPAIAASDPCDEAVPTVQPPRYRPVMPEIPVTQAAPYDHQQPPPATRTLEQDPRRACAALELRTSADPLLPVWRPVPDLLAAGPTTEAFVVELEDDGTTALRFGDGVHGRRPPSGVTFRASCRVGTGRLGNIGADAIGHVLSADTGVVRARNPLAATGGTEPEAMERVRQIAPAAFRVQERAVTPEDYAYVARGTGRVQHARATPRWTGSWRAMVVTVDPVGGDAPAPALQDRVRERLEVYRMAGHDVSVRRPRYVPLEIALTVCVASDHLAAHVERALLTRLGSGTLPDGTRGLFHPDNYTFGDAVWLSQVYAAARSVPGVASVTVTDFRRQGATGAADLVAGRIRLDRLELPRLANDRNFPERGTLRLTMQGGK